MIYRLNDIGEALRWTDWLKKGGCQIPNDSIAPQKLGPVSRWGNDVTLGDIQKACPYTGRVLARFAVDFLKAEHLTEHYVPEELPRKIYMREAGLVRVRKTNEGGHLQYELRKGDMHVIVRCPGYWKRPGLIPEKYDWMAFNGFGAIFAEGKWPVILQDVKNYVESLPDTWLKEQRYIDGTSEHVWQNRCKQDLSLAEQKRIQKWLKIGKANPWIAEAVDPPFDRRSFIKVSCYKELEDFFRHGNWSLGTAVFVEGTDFCFINQANGGDEWLVIKQDMPFESFTTQALIQSKPDRYHVFTNKMEEAYYGIWKSTKEECKKLEYLKEPVTEKELGILNNKTRQLTADLLYQPPSY